MAQSIHIPGGILTLTESKDECPHCERHIPFNEIEEKWVKQDEPFMKMKCKCNRFIGITSDIRGDFVAYKL